MAWRRAAAVHAMADSRINWRDACLATGEFIRRVFGSDVQFVIRMRIIKAGEAAARGSGGPWQADKIYEEAVALCDKALAGGPNAAVLSYKGIALAALGRHGEALGAYDRAAEIDPGNAGHHAGRGDALSALGRRGEALGAYDRAGEINPGGAGHHAGRGAMLAALGRHGEAQAARDEAARPARGRNRA